MLSTPSARLLRDARRPPPGTPPSSHLLGHCRSLITLPPSKELGLIAQSATHAAHPTCRPTCHSPLPSLAHASLPIIASHAHRAPTAFCSSLSPSESLGIRLCRQVLLFLLLSIVFSIFSFFSYHYSFPFPFPFSFPFLSTSPSLLLSLPLLLPLHHLLLPSPLPVIPHRLLAIMSDQLRRLTHRWPTKHAHLRLRLTAHDVQRRCS